MINFVRDHKKNVIFLVLIAVFCTVLASGWSGEHKKRVANNELATQRLNEKQQTIDSTREINVGLMAANAIIMGSYRWEAQKAGQMENQRNVANGRLGPLQRRINQLESELNCERRQHVED